MSKKTGRIAQDQLLASVEQAIALERQRIDSIPDEQLGDIGGGFEFPSSPTLPGFPKPSDPTMGLVDLPFPSAEDVLGI